jgi:hypothetical protein
MADRSSIMGSCRGYLGPRESLKDCTGEQENESARLNSDSLRLGFRRSILS